MASVALADIQVPRDKPQIVHVQTRDFPAGIQTGWHVHPGVEVAYVTAGEVSLATRAGIRRLGPGDRFVMPRGMPHNCTTIGQGTAKLVITLVVDAGVPMRQAVSAP